MGLLDGLLGASGGGLGGADAGHKGLVEAAMGMIGNQASGGLGGMIDKFKGAGLGSIVASWVGTGANQPVSADQVTSALGQDQIAQLAAKFGLSKEQVAGHLSQILPGLVDHLTPNGQVPADHSLVQSALGMLKGRIFGH